jgi:putative PIN family toxin of toxin-antitoxin system
LKVVIDTSVLVAAVRSARGASRELLRMVLDGELTPLVSVPLVLEYEAVLTRAEHLESAASADVHVEIVRAFCTMGEPVHIAHSLRPQLVDPDDEFVLEAAYHGRADAIITLNTRDFVSAARRFGIATLKPGEALERIRNR